MLRHHIWSLFIMLIVLGSCSKQHNQDTSSQKNIQQQLYNLSAIRTESEKNDNLETFLSYYADSAICMPEYQLTLQGVNEIRHYYKEIFQRQNIKTLERTADEFIDLGNTVIEIGTFKKEFIHSDSDTLLTQHGKYWNVWAAQSNGDFKVQGEAFGYFNHIDHPETLIVPTYGKQPNESDILSAKAIPFELKAYNALMEKGVRNRDGNLRASFFTDDARIFPFADSTKTGIDKIKPYLMAYSARGTVSIDSVQCYTFDFQNLDKYILEYCMFKVKWNRSGTIGRTEGKGIRLWKRQPDNSLRLHREIGTHNHLQ